MSSAGFWPGGANSSGGPFFYSYAYPAPTGFADAEILPSQGRYDAQLGEFILDYEVVRCDHDSDAVLLRFLASTYAATANAAEWDRAALECPPGVPGAPRAI